MSKDLRPSLKTVATAQYTHDSDMGTVLKEVYEAVDLEQFTDIHIVVKKDIDVEKPQFRVITKARSKNEDYKEPSEAIKEARLARAAEKEEKDRLKAEEKAKKAEEKEKLKAEREEARKAKAAEKKKAAETTEGEPKKKVRKSSKKTETPVEETTETPVEEA